MVNKWFCQQRPHSNNTFFEQITFVYLANRLFSKNMFPLLYQERLCAEVCNRILFWEKRRAFIGFVYCQQETIAFNLKKFQYFLKASMLSIFKTRAYIKSCRKVWKKKSRNATHDASLIFLFDLNHVFSFSTL